MTKLHTNWKKSGHASVVALAIALLVVAWLIVAAVSNATAQQAPSEQRIAQLIQIVKAGIEDLDHDFTIDSDWDALIKDGKITSAELDWCQRRLDVKFSVTITVAKPESE